jgi:hypothetical protein
VSLLTSFVSTWRSHRRTQSRSSSVSTWRPPRAATLAQVPFRHKNRDVYTQTAGPTFTEYTLIETYWYTRPRAVWRHTEALRVMTRCHDRNMTSSGGNTRWRIINFRHPTSKGIRWAESNPKLVDSWGGVGGGVGERKKFLVQPSYYHFTDKDFLSWSRLAQNIKEQQVPGKNTGSRKNILSS